MKKRILIVQNRLSFGGTTSIIMFLVRNLSNEYIFDLFSFDESDDGLEKEFLSYGGSIIRNNKYHISNGKKGKIKKYWYRSFGIFGKSLKKQVQQHYDAIHCFEENLSAYYLKVAKLLGIEKRIVHYNIDHTTKKRTNLINRILENKEIKMVNKYATDIIGCSSKSIPISLLESKKIKKINNPIAEKYSFCPAAPKALSLLQIGRICDNKNQLFSLEILVALLNKFNSSNLTISFVGQIDDSDRTYYNDLLAYISKNNLQSYVNFYNPTQNLMPLMEQSTFLLFPSKEESFGMVLIEAQSVGLHCFSSLAAPAETNLGGVTYTKLSDGPSMWADKISTFYEQTMGERKNFDTSSFSPKNIIAEYRKLYE